MVELQERLEKWGPYHLQSIMDAWSQCIRVWETLDNVHSYIMYVSVLPRKDHGGRRAKYFLVVSARRVPVAELLASLRRGRRGSQN